jgi:predicted kinase
LWLEAPVDVLVDRVASRRLDASDATPSVVRAQAGEPVDRMEWHRLDAAATKDNLFAAALAAIASGETA